MVDIKSVAEADAKKATSRISSAISAHPKTALSCIVGGFLLGALLGHIF